MALACVLVAHSREDGQLFHGIVGSHSTPRAVWPTFLLGQVFSVGSSVLDIESLVVLERCGFNDDAAHQLKRNWCDDPTFLGSRPLT